MSRTFLVATVRNEAPYLLEWVAHHIETGFTDIAIYQNDSDDLTHETLSALRDIGAIRYFYNRAGRGQHQVRAYTRASALPEYAAADWAMALDLDEFLLVKTGNGRLADLLAAVPEVDCLHLNWRLFGHGGHLLPSDDLVTERFQHARSQLGRPDDYGPYKCLFRPGLFARPGIHRPADPQVPIDTIRTANGSGLAPPDYLLRNFNATDPGGCRLAQINHYITRDVASFLLKGQRGSAHQADRPIGRRYWTMRNHNEDKDFTILRFLPRIRARMATLDAASGGRLMELRDMALHVHLARFHTLMQDPQHRQFYAFCLANDCGLTKPQADVAPAADARPEPRRKKFRNARP
ncbi:MAG: glycosyltransferase family 2 protein [Paracoccaceae bacterium]|nr:MAG: glycosyltransferase family 2 protein [Paracoccaceae bacterium]